MASRSRERRTTPEEPLPSHVERRRESGARHAHISLKDRLRSYILNHRQVALLSLVRLMQVPLSSLLTWAVIAIALALPAGMFLILQNAQQLSGGWDKSVQISVYLKMETSIAEGRKLAEQLQARADVSNTEYISRADALTEFREYSGFGEALEYLDENPLPAVILVQPNHLETDVVEAQKLLQTLRRFDQVEQVHLDLEWVQRLYSIMALGERAVLILGLLLSLAVLLIIGNTVRLAIESRKAEIVVIKLVGGTNAFVRRPFLYAGIWYGLGGGSLAWLLLNLILIWLGGPVDRLVQAYNTDFDLSGLGLTNSLLLLLFSAVLGLVGAWISVGRHLAAIEPN